MTDRWIAAAYLVRFGGPPREFWRELDARAKGVAVKPKQRYSGLSVWVSRLCRWFP